VEVTNVSEFFSYAMDRGPCRFAKVSRLEFHDGTSYEINDKIVEMMSDCGLLIGNLTHCNPNVYHEIGFVMGKAKAEGHDVANMLLFLDESVLTTKTSSSGSTYEGLSSFALRHWKTNSCPLFERSWRSSINCNPDTAARIRHNQSKTRATTKKEPGDLTPQAL
jgi:hypothetical protein